MGNSMGGFAALLFGALMNASKVVAFAPQTFISPQLRLLHRESRWRQRTYRTYCRYGVFRRTYDVKPFLKTTPHVSADIYVGKNDHHDFIHAARLSPLSSVSIHQVDGAGHGVAKMLREIGELDLILRGLCETH
jgi:acetyl esterase/lipase